MSNFEQFLGGSEKLGEVIPMVSSEMPYVFSASGGTYLRSGYATPNTSGLYSTYEGLTHTGTVILTPTEETIWSSLYPLLKSGTNYINSKYYTTDLTSTWTAATGGTYPPTILRSSFIVGTTVVVTTTNSGYGMVEYSTDNGVTYTNVTGNNLNCTGTVNDAGTLAVVIKTSSAGTTAGHIYTSTDGITWTSRTPSIAVGDVYSLIWSPLLSAFVIRAANGTYSTTDGYTLTLLTTNTVDGSTASSTTSMVSVASNLSTFSRTTDGVTWSTATSLVSGQTLYTLKSIAYVNGAYYALGGYGVVFKSIDDGLTWERFFVSLDDTYALAGVADVPRIGWIDGALFLSTGGKLKTNVTLTVNGVMAKVKAEPTEGYAYVRIL